MSRFSCAIMRERHLVLLRASPYCGLSTCISSACQRLLLDLFECLKPVGSTMELRESVKSIKLHLSLISLISDYCQSMLQGLISEVETSTYRSRVGLSVMTVVLPTSL
ncbi:hypothetical protein PENSPDRAFT_653176 [Peniophora sp. CONT]|nr:hypothetical protein PENSPDRAFT_653176 [Peniophora sp. CONT]